MQAGTFRFGATFRKVDEIRVSALGDHGFGPTHVPLAFDILVLVLVSDYIDW